MARLTITAHARADLQEIHSHIAKDKPEAALLGPVYHLWRTQRRGITIAANGIKRQLDDGAPDPQRTLIRHAARFGAFDFGRSKGV